jgi:hypothetical protein
MLWPLYLWGKSFRYPMDRRLGGPQNRPGHGKKKIPDTTWTQNPTIIQAVTSCYTNCDIPAKLYYVCISESTKQQYKLDL